jgi:hypothetical protein
LAGGGRRLESSRPAWAKLVRPYLKNKRARDGARALEASCKIAVKVREVSAIFISQMSLEVSSSLGGQHSE